jgi:hypothetical protein
VNAAASTFSQVELGDKLIHFLATKPNNQPTTSIDNSGSSRHEQPEIITLLLM